MHFSCQNIIDIIIAGGKIGSFGVCLWVGLCGRANPKCANVGWHKIIF